MRKKIDYKFALAILDKNNEFDAYRVKHQSISFNRCARSFLVSKGYDYKRSCFVVPEGMTAEQHFINILKANWIDN